MKFLTVFVLCLISILSPFTESATSITEKDTSLSPFISSLVIRGVDISNVNSIKFRILRKPTFKSKEISATFLRDSLKKSNDEIILPIFGMYANYKNSVEVSVLFNSGSEDIETVSIPTEGYRNDLYDDIRLSQPYTNVGSPRISFIFVKSRVSGPIVLDIDGQIRWASEFSYNAGPSLFDNNAFVTFTDDALCFRFLDDTAFEKKIETADLTGISQHHDISKSENGYLLEIDASINGTRKIESILIEVDVNGTLVSTWDFGEIISQHIESNGENSSLWIRDGIDWFHMNSAIQDSMDSSIIASSRENFVIKVDYTTGNIIWILGDEEKFWYKNFTSLQELSVRLNNTNEKPIGQHSLSLTNNPFELMLFNNQLASFAHHHPDGASLGINDFNSSFPVRYIIDSHSRTGAEVWRYDSAIHSIICSSVYGDFKDDQINEYLITYAHANIDSRNDIISILQIVNEEGDIIFEAFREKDSNSRPCRFAWNSIIIDLSNLTFHDYFDGERKSCTSDDVFTDMSNKAFHSQIFHSSLLFPLFLLSQYFGHFL